MYISVYGLLCQDPRPTSGEAGVVYDYLLWKLQLYLDGNQGVSEAVLPIIASC